MKPFPIYVVLLRELFNNESEYQAFFLMGATKTFTRGNNTDYSLVSKRNFLDILGEEIEIVRKEGASRFWFLSDLHKRVSFLDSDIYISI